MDINEFKEMKAETERQEKEIRDALGVSLMTTPVSELAEYEGKNVFIRSVTHHYTGLCVKAGAQFLKLEDAAWIADDGRFHKAMQDSENFSEVEPYAAPVSIGIGAILDITVIESLPKGVK